jgi:CCR4-NOT transcription complex subunit 1
MRLPDPFTPNLKVDLLPEISQSPRILSKYQALLDTNNLKSDIDQYLKTRPNPSFLNELLPKLMEDSGNGVRRFSSTMINALVLHVGVQAISQLQAKSSPVTSPSAPMDIFQWLANSLDMEGRYLFLNAIANQLRYPNNHTHYFSCVLLYLFMDAQHDVLKEQITRVLLERLIVNRPHPWGLLITFIELIKNPRYNFWNHSFTRCAPEIERLFESVARSCMGPSGAHGVGNDTIEST